MDEPNRPQGPPAPKPTREDFERASKRVRERLNEWRRQRNIPEVDYDGEDQ